MLQSSDRRQVVQMINYGLLTGVAVWTLLLVRGAQILHAQPERAMYNITFGPLSLAQLHRHIEGRRVTAGFSAESGLLWYVLVWAMIGVTLGTILVIRTRKATQK